MRAISPSAISSSDGSVGGPFESSLDLTLLPGIPGGELAFVMSIENNLRGGADRR